MAFNDLLEGEGTGVAWLVEVLNAAGTVQYRYATGALRYSSNDYDGRIVSLGTIERAFSAESLPAAGSCEMVLDNTDNGADWLCNRSTVASAVFASRFRLYMVLWDATAAYDAAPSFTRRQMGEYVCLDFPRRDSEGKVYVSLVDDTLGRIADLATAPTPNEWAAAVDLSVSFGMEPLHASFLPIKRGDWNTPMPLVFGSRPIKPLIPCSQWASATVTQGYTVLGVCAVVDNGSSFLDQYATQLTMGLSESAQRVLRRERFPIPQEAQTRTGTFETVWYPAKSDLVVKEGRNWRVIFFMVNRNALNRYIVNYANSSFSTNPLIATVVSEMNVDENFDDFEVTGFPLSCVNSSGLTPHPVDVIKDLIQFYSAASAGDIDTTNFATVKASLPGYEASGTVSPVKQGKGAGVGERLSPWNANVLRTTLGEICASADLDLFLGWDGLYRLASHRSGFAEQTDTLVALREETVESVEEHVPSTGERWAPYNRVFVDVGEGDQLGPYDNVDGISDFGRILPRIISAKWTPPKVTGDFGPWKTRQLESMVRPVLKVVAPIEVLRFDLADLVTFSWTRGVGSGGTPYDGSCFKVEGITVNPETNRCTLTLVWQGDLRDASNYPFLLDSETLITRVSASGGRTATVQNTSTTVTFNTGSLVSDGVQAGDFLILEDATLAENNWSRFRALLIASITDATHLVISDSDLNFGSAAPVAVAAWSIRKSHATYPTAISDPTNYPSGAVVYGKVATDAGTYTDAGTSDANRLLDG